MPQRLAKAAIGSAPECPRPTTPRLQLGRGRAACTSLQTYAARTHDALFGPVCAQFRKPSEASLRSVCRPVAGLALGAALIDRPSLILHIARKDAAARRSPVLQQGHPLAMLRHRSHNAQPANTKARRWATAAGHASS